jgi:hypothetical protein
LRRAHRSHRDWLPFNRRGQNGPLAPQLKQKRADLADVRFCRAFARSNYQPTVMLHVRPLGQPMVTFGVVVVMVVVIVVPVLVPMDGAANHVQTVMVPGVRLKRMQTLPEQRNPAVSGKEHTGQQFSGRGMHDTNGQSALQFPRLATHPNPKLRVPASDFFDRPRRNR